MLPKEASSLFSRSVKQHFLRTTLEVRTQSTPIVAAKKMFADLKSKDQFLPNVAVDPKRMHLAC